MNWFRKFMIGRYGNDELSYAFIALFALLTLCYAISGNTILQLLDVVILIICYYRMFSKNINKRYQENVKFLRMINPIRFWFQKKVKHMKERKTHKFYHCPNCKQVMRVPKGRGEITITCPKCHTKFDKRT